ncbi:M-phase inducer phosphatase isoform X2 [Planococcus citri]|uniref:M-phase inducer phosphatase isoform X2 n=1 Tax=Planococcus citri TaxID=170843 RepID=UPI0031FA208E
MVSTIRVLLFWTQSPKCILLMAKHQKSEPGSISPSNSSRLLFGSRRLSHNTIPANKENSSSLRSAYSMEYSSTIDDDVSPSKFTMARNVIRERFPLEDQDPNSQDSGYSNSSSLYSDDSKSSSNFRFAEPNGVPPRRQNTVEFSPGRDLIASPMGKKSCSVSPRYRKQIVFHSMSTDSTSSDFSDDGFGENLMLPSTGSLMMEQDENAQLPAGFNALLSGTIFNTNKITTGESSPPHTESSLLQTSLRRSLTENITPNRAVIKSSVETEFSELLIYEKETTKRTAAQEEEGSAPFLKRRKPNKLICTPSDKTIIKQGPATAPAISIKETLFSYGFTKTHVKLHRSFSETEATITNALQRSNSDPNLIGDFTKPFVLPLKMGKHSDLKNIDCHTLAKLINGEYDHTIRSYTIIDCRYPYEYEGGHIKGAINLYTKEQMMEELKEKKYVQINDSDAADGDNNKRNILIFHCEFSSERGPSLSRYLRNQDREKNSFQYPKLDYPEIYLLDGGYSKFYQHHKELCDPCSYRPMTDPNHSAELRAFKARSKSWACTGDNRKLRNTYLKRLGL